LTKQNWLKVAILTVKIELVSPQNKVRGLHPASIILVAWYAFAKHLRKTYDQTYKRRFLTKQKWLKSAI
jgi:hypothetical protein